MAIFIKQLTNKHLAVARALTDANIVNVFKIPMFCLLFFSFQGEKMTIHTNMVLPEFGVSHRISFIGEVILVGTGCTLSLRELLIYNRYDFE